MHRMNAAQAKELERKRQEQLLEQARQLQQQLREDRHLYSYRLLILQDTYKIFDSTYAKRGRHVIVMALTGIPLSHQVSPRTSTRSIWPTSARVR